MSIEKIERALRDGLEGVTPGPWGVYAEPDVGMFGDVFAGKLGDDDFGPIWNRTCNLEHIARCSPENIRAILDELSRLREALRPFAAAANCHSNDKEFMPDAMLIWRGGECTIRLGDLRRARALSEREGQE